MQSAHCNYIPHVAMLEYRQVSMQVTSNGLLLKSLVRASAFLLFFWWGERCLIILVEEKQEVTWGPARGTTSKQKPNTTLSWLNHRSIPMDEQPQRGIKCNQSTLGAAMKKRCEQSRSKHLPGSKPLWKFPSQGPASSGLPKCANPLCYQ